MNPKNNITWIIVASILSVALIVSASIGVTGIKEIKSDQNFLTVKGSAKKQIVSDFVVWTGSYSANASELDYAYQLLKDSEQKVKKYLLEQGLDEENIVFSSINTYTQNRILPNGAYTNEIESYNLSQSVTIESKDVDKITKISRNATELIEKGVKFDSYQPQYFYTKLADLKIEMIEAATTDALKRAEVLLGVTNTKPGHLLKARVGIFQITPLYSNEISDYGINDTSSLNKEITAVVSCDFEVN